MDDGVVSISTIDSIEEGVEQLSKNKLADLLEYFNFIQETLLIAFNNSRNFLVVKNSPNNPKLFAYLSTARVFATSKIAMDITIRGYPLEGIALTRPLLELVQCTQYLVRHEKLIDGYLSGSIKIDDILKQAKNEKTKPDSNHFGRLWGLVSQYVHASPDFLTLPITHSDNNKMTLPLVISDLERIEDTAYVIMVSLFSQYLIFRAVLIDDLQVANQLNERDRVIFAPKNVRKFAKFGAISDKDLEDLYSVFTSKSG
jgi:sulfur relay (sulfurtransferase) DsrF/TusC family protein